jgi:hypothetical protein
LADGPAIEMSRCAAVVDAMGHCLLDDQRSFGLPCVVNRMMDIGVFESQGFSNIVSSNNQGATLNTHFDRTLQLTVSSAFDESVNGGLA